MNVRIIVFYSLIAVLCSCSAQKNGVSTVNNGISEDNNVVKRQTERGSSAPPAEKIDIPPQPPFSNKPSKDELSISWCTESSIKENKCPRVDSLAISPNGNYVVAGKSDGTISFLDLTTGKEIRSQKIRKSTGSFMKGIVALAFSPDSSLLAVGNPEDREILLLHSDTGKTVMSLDLGRDSYHMSQLAFSADAKTLAAVRPDATEHVLFFDVSSGKKLPASQFDELSGKYITDLSSGSRSPLTAHDAKGCSLAYSPDGKLLAVGTEKKIVFIVDAATRKTIRIIGPLEGHQFTGVAFSPDSKHLAVKSCNEEAAVIIVDPNTGVVQKTLYGMDGFGNISYSPDGRLLFVSGKDLNNRSNIIRIWDTATYKILKTIDKGQEKLALAPNGEFLIYNSFQFIRAKNLFDVSTQQLVNEKRAKELNISLDTFNKKLGELDTFRTAKNFEGYAEAFKYSRSKEDFQALQNLAVTPEQKKTMEYLAILAVDNKFKLFDIEAKFSNFNAVPPTRDAQSEVSLWIIKADGRTTKAEFSGNATLKLNKLSPITNLKHKYRVYAKHTLEYISSETKTVSFIVYSQSKSKNVVKHEVLAEYEIGPGANSSKRLDFGTIEIARKTEVMGSVSNIATQIETDPVVTSEIYRVEQL
jgi:WD40 repeat protein